MKHRQFGSSKIDRVIEKAYKYIRKEARKQKLQRRALYN